MSSSKVLKSDTGSTQVSDFAFQSISHAMSRPQESDSSGASGFTPMALFDTSELSGKVPGIRQQPASEPAEQPPGQFVTDDLMQQQLSEAYERGLIDGKNLAERGLVNVFKGLRTAAEDIERLREKVLRDSEDDMLDLVVAIARRIILRESQEDRQVVLRVIRAAIASMNDIDDLVVRIHPDDYALLTTSQSEALKRELATIRFTLKPDSSIHIGSCQVDAELGTVDAGFEAQLEEIYRRLKEAAADQNPQDAGVASAPTS
jgi:flagellar assembly protein FliH